MSLINSEIKSMQPNEDGRLESIKLMVNKSASTENLALKKYQHDVKQKTQK